MAKNLAIQKAIRSEIHEVLQNDPPTMEDIPHLPLVEASIYETQRIRSVVPVGIPHGATEEVEVDGFRIPKGTMIVPLQWAVHMNEQAWDNPEKFDPARFINEEGKVVRNSYFIPYQIGKCKKLKEFYVEPMYFDWSQLHLVVALSSIFFDVISEFLL